MPRPHHLCLLLLPATLLPAQVTRTSVPLADKLTRALALSSLTTPGAQPFHLRLTIAEPDNPQSPYHGAFELWWASPTDFRQDLTGPGTLRQFIVTHNGERTEQDTGDYLPLWLRNFSTLALNPVPNPSAWSAPGLTVEQLTMPTGARSDACVHATSQLGTGPNTTPAFSSICFDPDGRLKFVGGPRGSMSFASYHKFAGKQVARELSDDPEPGTRLVGIVTTLENLSPQDQATLLAPLPSTDDRFHTVTVDAATMAHLTADAPPLTWPTVHSGNTHGRLSLYTSADSTGRVREAWPLNSDNAGLQDAARAQVAQWLLKPATAASGKPVQIDGGLAFTFDTSIADPLPQLSDPEVRALATHIEQPDFPAGQLHSGQVITVSISIDEQGQLTGLGWPPDTPTDAQGPILNAIRGWRFRPYLRDGKPQYIHGHIRFVVP